jgi:hypothetical protein
MKSRGEVMPKPAVCLCEPLRKHLGPVCWPVEPEKFALAMQSLPEAEVQALVLGHLAEKINTFASVQNLDVVEV